MSNVKKVTKKEMFMQLKNNYDLTVEEVAFIDHEIELLERKNSSDKKPTATQQANEEIKKGILEGMEQEKQYTITDLIKEIPACEGLTNQKVSALVKQLVTSELVARLQEGRKTYFKLV